MRDVTSVAIPGKVPSGLVYGSPLTVAQANFTGKHAGELAFILANNTNFELAVFVPTGQRGYGFRPGPVTVLQPSGFTPFSIVAGDFNGDGRTDIAVSYSNTGFISSFVQVYLGKGDGTFTTGSQLTVPMVGVDMIAADFNGDGKLDVASSSGFMALGNGDGTFQPATLFYHISPSVNTLGTWLAAADFNHDGKLDIAFQTPQNPGGSQPLLIFLGNGDGTFQSPSPYQWGSLPAWGAMADLNGDGNQDIVILSAEHPHDSVAVFLGNADGTFQPATYVALPFTSMPLSIVAADLNGDGKPDLAVMDWMAAAVHVFAGNGDGTFGPDTEFGGPLNMTWIGYGNYQGQTHNGYPDLVMVAGGANSFFKPNNPITSAIATLLNDGAKK